MSAIAVLAPPPTIISWLRAAGPLHHERLRAEHLSTAATTVLAIGVAISILTTSDKEWWRLHFSTLGTYPDLSGHVFNATIIVAGVLFGCFAIRTRTELLTLARPSSRRRCEVFAFGVGSLGVHLSAVGMIPLNANEFLHDRAASGAMLSFIVVLSVATHSQRELSTRLRVVTLGVIAALTAGIAAFATGHINLAAFELIGFSLIGLWTAVFSRALHRRMLHRERPVPLPVAATGTTPPTAATEPTAMPDRHPADAAPGEGAEPTHHVPTLLHRALTRPPRSRPPRAPVLAHGVRVPPRPGCKGSEAPAASAPSRR